MRQWGGIVDVARMRADHLEDAGEGILPQRRDGGRADGRLQPDRVMPRRPRRGGEPNRIAAPFTMERFSSGALVPSMAPLPWRIERRCSAYA